MAAREGFNPDKEIPVRRGRRSQEMALAMQQDDNADEVMDAEVVEDDDQDIMDPGDLLGSKITIQMEIDGKDAWFTKEAKTRVREGEDEESASERLRLVVINRVLQTAEVMEAAIEERKNARRNTQIQPR